jgi:flagellar assembly protein FliH
MQNIRIPADKTSGFSSWKLPEVKDGVVVQAEKLRNRGSRGELINVNKNEIIYSALTAGQLEEITQQAYEDVRQQAHEEGLQQGRKKGYQEGLVKGQQTIDSHAKALNDALHSLMTFLQGQDDEVEQALVNLSTCIASAVVRRELSIDSTQIKAVVHEAIASLPVDSENIHIFLSEQDRQYLTQSGNLPENWNLETDVSLSPGGCRVVTQHSVIDYTLEEQFQQTVNALVEQRFSELASQAHKRQQGDADDSASTKA